MELKQLRYFLSVAKLANFTRAAENLSVVQPALSRQIQKLERELGTALFLRGGRSLILTDAGKVLLQHASYIIKQVDRAKEHVVAEGSTPKGTVSIGAPPSIAHSFFPKLVEMYRRDHPGVKVRLIEGMTHNLISWVRSDVIDIALVSHPSAKLFHGSELVTVSNAVFVEGMCLFGSNRISTLPPAVEVRELADYPLILAGVSTLSLIGLDQSVDASEQGLSVVIEVESQTIMKELVRRGLGFGVAPMSAIYKDHADFQSARLNGVALTRTLVRRADKPLSPAVSELTRTAEYALSDFVQEGRFQIALSN